MLFNQTGNGGGGGDIPIIFDEMYDDAHPSKITIDCSGKDIPYLFLGSNGYVGFMQYVSLAIIKCNSIPLNGLSNLFQTDFDTLKIKVKANGTIGRGSFGTVNRNAKIWIPNAVTSILCNGSNDGQFIGTAWTAKLYCEATSQPSGWNQYWNAYDASGNLLSTTWGVTEAAFDAL